MVEEDTVLVRLATDADIDGLVASSTRLFAEDGGTRDPLTDTTWPANHGAKAFANSIASDDNLVVVAVHDDNIVGHLTGVLDEGSQSRPGKIATLRSMYVRPEHRGGGVGARLVAEFRKWAGDVGADRMTVTAYATNEGAQRFYQRQGFTPMFVSLETTP
ncbi:GNAT family N-acetyltransferase [Fodinicola acaciae]|uniref:GNAT family N-acetyltransferase n=1 Tax=Fodinicola acaciae TaxID=2681555 RepID=UPI0013D53D12|nr:GNAT family N-acetyltransferase [Fodinicola acaciae]